MSGDWISVADRVPEVLPGRQDSEPVLGIVQVGDWCSSWTRAIVIYRKNARPIWKLAGYDDMPLAKNLRSHVEVIAWMPMAAYPQDLHTLQARADKAALDAKRGVTRA